MTLITLVYLILKVSLIKVESMRAYRLYDIV
jgi:hypothetical protein